MVTRPGRPWYKPRKSDLLFVVGMIGFGSQLLRAAADPNVIYASIALMGIPVIQRIDAKCEHEGPGT